MVDIIVVSYVYARTDLFHISIVGKWTACMDACTTVALLILLKMTTVVNHRNCPTMLLPHPHIVFQMVKATLEDGTPLTWTDLCACG